MDPVATAQADDDCLTQLMSNAEYAELMELLRTAPETSDKSTQTDSHDIGQ